MRADRKLILVSTLTLTAVFSFVSSPAFAQSQHNRAGQGPTRAECSISSPANFSPGIGMAPGSGRLDSAGEMGSITCEGTIYGHRITGTGTFGYEGTFTDSTCISHAGSGSSYFTVPTEAGPVPVSGGGFMISGIGLFGNVHATHTGVQFTGSYALTPSKGSCVAEPMTEATVLMRGSLRDLPDQQSTFRCDLDAAIVQLNCRSDS
jgi:hypothetical protein